MTKNATDVPLKKDLAAFLSLQSSKTFQINTASDNNSWIACKAQGYNNREKINDWHQLHLMQHTDGNQNNLQTLGPLSLRPVVILGSCDNPLAQVSFAVQHQTLPMAL